MRARVSGSMRRAACETRAVCVNLILGPVVYARQSGPFSVLRATYADRWWLVGVGEAAGAVGGVEKDGL